MNTSALAFSFPRQQHGAASVAIVLLLVFILSAAVMAVLRVSGSSVSDSSTNEAQVSALSLAESGLERAQATLTLAGYTNAACASLAGATSNLGRGNFRYTAAVFNAGVCTVTVTGTIGTSSRTIRAALSNAPAPGVAGNGSTIPLRLTTGVNNAGVITNLSYPNGAAAAIGTCTNPANCADVLQVTGAGANGLSNRSVFESVAAPGVYAITQTLVNAGNPAPRNFVQVAAAFTPAGAAPVGHVGAFAAIGNTTGTGGAAGGTIRANWNCAPNSGTGGANVAAGANTLVYGFSSLAAPANQLSAVTIGGQPLNRIRNLTGNQGDNLYSQLWTANNPVYLSGNGTTSGAVVTGYAGKGSMNAKPNGSNLCITSTSPYSGETFDSGDDVSGSNLVSDTQMSGPIQTSGASLCACNGGDWDDGMCKGMMMSSYSKACPLNKPQTSTSSATVMVAAKLLTVTAAPKPFLEAGDTIYVGGVAKGKIVAQLSGTTGGVGTYSLDSNQLFSPSTITSNGSTIGTAGATIPGNGIPTVGTIVAKNSGTGVLPAGARVGGNPAPNAARFRILNPDGSIWRPSSQAQILSGAQVCGGVCALLDHDGTTTAFALDNIGAADNWSSGFTCLSNVNAAIGPGEVIDPQRGQWSEVVR